MRRCLLMPQSTECEFSSCTTTWWKACTALPLPVFFMCHLIYIRQNFNPICIHILTYLYIYVDLCIYKVGYIECGTLSRGPILNLNITRCMHICMHANICTYIHLHRYIYDRYVKICMCHPLPSLYVVQRSSTKYEQILHVHICTYI